MKFATAYTHNKTRSMKFSTFNKEESLTQQTDKNDADINVIVGRFMKTGQLPNITAPAITGNFSSMTDFRDMQNQILEAKEAFQSLPANVRSRFDNDPAKFIDFAVQEENLPELTKMGLADPRPAPTITPPATPPA